MFTLLLQRRFLPFFLCQFCGAFNDSVFRLALVSMLAFGAFKSDFSAVVIQLSAAVFMLPFFLFSAAAGELSDALPKRRLLLAVKGAEVAVTSLAAAALFWQSLPLALLCLFCAGVQSAFFGPLKYALLPQLLKRQELLNGNAWFSVSTFAAILGGTVLGTLGGKSPQTAAPLAAGLVALALLGLVAAVLVPSPATAPSSVPPPFAPWRAFGNVMRTARKDAFIFHCILAGSWFWLVGTLLLNELAQQPYAVYTHLLAAVLLGTLCGALACQMLLRGRISTQHAPLTLFVGGLLLLSISRYAADAHDSAPPGMLLSVAAFSAVMTLYVVPLRTAIQDRAADDIRARIIAAYNIFNALFIVLAALLAAALHAASAGASQQVLLLTCVLSLVGSVLVWRVVPIEAVRRTLLPLLRLLFRVRVHGLEHLREHSTVLCNHQSFWDGLLLAVFLQDEKRQFGFAIDVEQSRRFIIRQALKLVRAYPLNPMEPQRVRTLIREMQNARDGVMPLIFPEGRITVSGNLMKCYPGAGIVAEKISNGKVTPVIIDGLQYSTFSRMQGKFRLRLFPPVTITIFPPRQLSAPPHLRAASKRQWFANQMGYMLEECLFQVRQGSTRNLTTAFAAAAARHGHSKPLFAEFPARQLSYRQVFIAACALGSVLRQRHSAGARIGLLLPSSLGAAVCFMAAQFQHLSAVMLNPSVGAAQALSCCKTVALDTVYTSERLLQRSPATVQIVDALRAAGIQVILLEEVRQQITLRGKLAAAVGGLFLQTRARRLPGWHSPGDAHAAVLFTSGSEGVPKGVALSHRNLLTNCAQVMARLDVTPQDTMLNALPVFHSFGLLAGVVLPVQVGVETWQYPSPLHYKMIPEALYGCNATVFFSANTFLYHYGKAAHPLDMRALRLVFAGAEKLREETRRLWLQKFGVRVLEGYGVTETSPALCVNTPLGNRPGTVGRILPGITTHLEEVEGIAEGGRLWVRGGNVMEGYFTAAAPGQLQPPPQGWHDTGDIVDIDADDYLTIKGRAKRFVKVAGEMVPLDGLEECLRAKWQEAQFAVVGVADARRGEALALMTTANLSREDIAAALREASLPELWQPRHLRCVRELPLLSTGKVDYPAVAREFN